MSSKKEEFDLNNRIKELEQRIQKCKANKINSHKIKELELQKLKCVDRLYELSS